MEVRDASRLTVLYDGGCARCTRTARRLKRLDRRRGRLRCVPLQDVDPPAGVTRTDLERELHVVAPEGTVEAGWDAVVAIARRVRLLRPLVVASHVPGVAWLGRRWYRRTAGRRECVGCVDEPVAVRSRP